MRAILNRRKKLFHKNSQKDSEEPNRLYASTSCYELANGEVYERQPLRLRTKSAGSYDYQQRTQQGARYPAISLENISANNSALSAQCLTTGRKRDSSMENMYVSKIPQPRSRRSAHDPPNYALSSISSKRLSNGFVQSKSHYSQSESCLQGQEHRIYSDNKSTNQRGAKDHSLTGIDCKTVTMQERVDSYHQRQEHVDTGFGDLQARLRKLREGVNSLLNRHTTVNDKIENCKELDHVDSELEWNYYLKANRLLDKAVSLVLLDVNMKDRIIKDSR